MSRNRRCNHVRPGRGRLWRRCSERFEPTTFDYIFTRGFREVRARMLEVAPGVSDHWPVEVELILD
jgi:endonuclease/exonuclease/phosphatase family metal-dependent hydrolase